MTIAVSVPVSQAGSLISPLSVEIHPSKNTLRGREPVTGQVVIVNTAPEKLAAVFDVTAYHNGRVKYTSITSTKDIFFGKNQFDFKDFGIPQFNTGPGAAGFWRIEILQRNLDDSYKAFTVVNIEYPEGKDQPTK